jgi:hypothetical protein
MTVDFSKFEQKVVVDSVFEIFIAHFQDALFDHDHSYNTSALQ